MNFIVVLKICAARYRHEKLLEKILDKRNMNEAQKRICASKDAGGVKLD